MACWKPWLSFPPAGISPAAEPETVARCVRGVRGRIGVVRQPVRPHALGRAHPGLDQLRRCGRLVHRVELGLGQHAAAGRLDRAQDGLGRVLDAAPVAVDRAARGKHGVGVARDAMLADALRGRVQVGGPAAARAVAAAGPAQARHGGRGGAAAASRAEHAQQGQHDRAGAPAVRTRPLLAAGTLIASSLTFALSALGGRRVRPRRDGRRPVAKRSTRAALTPALRGEPRPPTPAVATRSSARPGRGTGSSFVLCLCHPRWGTMD